MSAQDLIAQELAGQQDAVPALMLALMAEGDLAGARLAWGRMSEAQRAAEPWLWEVCRALWQKDSGRALAAVQTGAELGARLERRVRAEAERLVGRAYGSISVAALGAMLALGEAEAAARAVELGWRVEGGHAYPQPVADRGGGGAGHGADARMQQLTQYAVDLGK